MRSGLAISMLWLIACGGSARQAPEPTTPTPAAAPVAAPAEHGEHGEHANHHPEFPPEVESFHDVLAPLWHAAPGAARTDNTCAALEDLADRAEAIATGDVPPLERDDQVSWQQHAELLVASVEQLEAACDAEGRPDFEAALTAVHEQFHALIEPLSTP